MSDIEITEEMIDAGLIVLTSGMGHSEHNPKSKLISTYIAMRSSEPSPWKPLKEYDLRSESRRFFLNPETSDTFEGWYCKEDDEWTLYGSNHDIDECNLTMAQKYPNMKWMDVPK